MESAELVELARKKLVKKFKAAENDVLDFMDSMRFTELSTKWDDLSALLDPVEKLGLELFRKYFVSSVKMQLDGVVWRSCCYQFVDKYRSLTKKRPELKVELNEILARILKRSITYFLGILNWVEKKHDITCDGTNGIGKFTRLQDGEPELSDCAFTLYTRLLVLIGDAHRYDSGDSSRLRQALTYYEKAVKVDPTKGRHFYQIAVVTKELRDLVGMAYHFTRAYIATVPIEEAKVNLQDLYDEVYKVYRKVEGKFWYNRFHKKEIFMRRRDIRKEVWAQTFTPQYVLPTLPEDPCTKEGHFANMPWNEIYNRFSICYTHYIGRIFTHIGLENLDRLAEESLVYFERLFHGKNKGVPPLRMVQIMILNMYTIKLITPQGRKSDAPRSKLDPELINFVQFCMEMFGILTEHLAKLIECCDWGNPLLDTLCIGIEIWCSWMEVNPKLWGARRRRPLFCVRKLHITIWENKRHLEDDIWIFFARLMTALDSALLNFSKTLFPSISETKDCQHTIRLFPQECNHLAELAFFSESSLINKEYFAMRSGFLHRAENYIRLKNIHRFGSETLFQRSDLMLKRELNNDLTHTYESLVRFAKARDEINMCGVDETHYFFYTENYNFPNPLDPVVKREKELKPDCNNARIMDILWKNRPKKKVGWVNPFESTVVFPKRPRMPNYEIWLFCSDRLLRTEIVIEPHRLVMDTNCFIRAFYQIKLLLNYILYPIFLPVSVILELRGLSKGGMTNKDKRKYGSIDNPDPALKIKLTKNADVARRCTRALDFIRDNKIFFHIITSTGRILSVRSPYDYMRDDIFDPKMTNDDRVLDTCKYLETRDLLARTKETPRRIFRKTVLLTSDRNLRIKCQSLDIPTRSLPSFFYWFTHARSLNEYLYRGRKKCVGEMKLDKYETNLDVEKKKNLILEKELRLTRNPVWKVEHGLPKIFTAGYQSRKKPRIYKHNRWRSWYSKRPLR